MSEPSSPSPQALAAAQAIHDMRIRHGQGYVIEMARIIDQAFIDHVTPHPTSPLITAMRYADASSPTKGLTSMPMMRPLRKRRGPVDHTVHKGSWQDFGPSHTPTPLNP